ncbi:hypothetical protein [Leifsonia virtsii]|uniref:Transmembrane protein n=1 Tax=Leifsonia virtsii TaxID=3035915 RepID=A0ABT8IV64_9MICO|nr:hypothetical protein [Leifsonia virtsii]MDN4596709.1 hypothetical protein [Leifsonia virtsii]
MTLKSWAVNYIGRPVTVADLVDLATVELDDPYSLLTALYGWKADHMATTAKALAGAGSAVALATLVPLIQVDSTKSIGWGWLIAAWVAASVLIAIGIIAFSFARRLHAEFVAAQALLGELVEIRAFIRRYRAQDGRL